MFFELEGKTYRIKFYRTGKTTIAELFVVDLQNKTAEGDEEGKNPLVSLGVYGVASVYHTDIFNKSTGRKVALANLLDALQVENQPIYLTKEDRAMIWAKYFETHKK